VIPTDPNDIKTLEALADRNIANGDWGDEVTIYGLPGETLPMTLAERGAKGTISHILSKMGGQRLPKRK